MIQEKLQLLNLFQAFKTLKFQHFDMNIKYIVDSDPRSARARPYCTF